MGTKKVGKSPRSEWELTIRLTAGAPSSSGRFCSSVTCTRPGWGAISLGRSLWLQPQPLLSPSPCSSRMASVCLQLLCPGLCVSWRFCLVLVSS